MKKKIVEEGKKKISNTALLNYAFFAYWNDLVATHGCLSSLHLYEWSDMRMRFSQLCDTNSRR